jgi:hypothetical protein
MTPPDAITRAEFEDRMDRLRKEIQTDGLRQDQEWNLGFRAIREDVKHGIDAVRDDVATRADALEVLFNARLDPVRAIAYGLVGTLLIGVLGSIVIGIFRKG